MRRRIRSGAFAVALSTVPLAVAAGPATAILLQMREDAPYLDGGLSCR
jgi:hypothetical protein